MRSLFAEAREYARLREGSEQRGERFRYYEADLEALIPYVTGAKPVMFSADTVDDILVVVDLAEELDVRAILRGGDDAWKVAGQLADANIPVLLSTVTRNPSSPYDLYDSAYASPARLHEAGVTFAFQSNSGSASRLLPFSAGMAAAFGLPPDVALRSVTLSTAEILGIEDQVGSLDVGKRADVIIVDGDPLQPVSNVRFMFIDGKPVNVDDNKHTQLYRKYQQRITDMQ